MDKDINDSEEVKKIMNLLYLMYTEREISEICNINKYKVNKIVKQLRKEGRWGKTFQIQITEKISQMLQEGKTPEKINEETGICYGYIIEFDKTRYKYTKKGKEHVEKTLAEIELLLDEGCIDEVVNLKKTLTNYWSRKINEIIIKRLYEEGKSPQEIASICDSKLEKVNKYIESFLKKDVEETISDMNEETTSNIENEKEEKSEENELENSRDNDNKNQNNDEEENIEEIDIYDTFKKEKSRNTKGLYILLKKIQNGTDTFDDLKIIKKIIDTYNVEADVVMEVIEELVKTENYKKIKLAEYCNNTLLYDEDIDKDKRKLLQKNKEKIKKKKEHIDKEILKMIKAKISNDEIAKRFNVNEMYIREVKALEDWTL